MTSRTKTTFIIAGVIGGLVILSIAAVSYVLFTESGSSFFVKKFADAMNDDVEVTWRQSGGTLIGGTTYQDITLENLKWFPVPNTLKIQALAVKINSLSLEGITVKIENARLILPYSDPILFYGTIENALLDLNFYTKSISDRQIKGLFDPGALRGITADIHDIDILVKGSLEEPLVTGALAIVKITSNGFSLEEAPCVFTLRFEDVTGPLKLHGPLTCQAGTIRGEKTAVVRLQESRILFSGNPENPELDIKASSTVENTKININLKGALKKPDLHVYSDPPMPEDRILLALATNKTWQTSIDLLNNETISPDLARDFIDYFLFGGQDDKFAKQFGLKSISVKYDAQGKGVAVTKDLSGRLEGRYEIEDRTQPEGQEDISQKIGGEYKVTDGLSLEAQRELKRTGAGGQQTDIPPDDQLLFKFKKSF